MNRDTLHEELSRKVLPRKLTRQEENPKGPRMLYLWGRDGIIRTWKLRGGFLQTGTESQEAMLISEKGSYGLGIQVFKEG